MFVCCRRGQTLLLIQDLKIFGCVLRGRCITFEQQCVVLKSMLQSPRLKYHVQTIGIEPSLSKNATYKHKCLENIKKLYKQAGKCDYQQQFKDLLRLICFLLLNDSTATVLYLPLHHHQSKNEVLENHCVCLLTFQM